MEPLERKATRVKARNTRAKISGGPNFRANSASGGDKTIRPMTPMVPAMNEAKAEIPSAAPARPWRVIWYPSRQVMTEAASPGILTRMDVVEPPYWVP